MQPGPSANQTSLPAQVHAGHHQPGSNPFSSKKLRKFNSKNNLFWSCQARGTTHNGVVTYALARLKSMMASINIWRAHVKVTWWRLYSATWTARDFTVSHMLWWDLLVYRHRAASYFLSWFSLSPTQPQAIMKIDSIMYLTIDINDVL